MTTPTRVLITAGPTREPIDAVRFISNRSSGAMGIALAQAAAVSNCEVTLLLGPGPAEPDLSAAARAASPAHVEPAAVLTHRVYRFNSSAELKQLLEAHFPAADLLIMAAAVCDYRPKAVAEGKLPSDKSRGLQLELEPTPDLVALCAARRRPGQRVIAFALEEAAHLFDRATAKMQRKGVDAIVANPLGAMESDAAAVTWLTADGRRDQLAHSPKQAAARWVIEHALSLAAGGSP